MSILDYYSLVRELERDFEEQSKEVADAFSEKDFSLNFITLHDGMIEENQLQFWRTIYGVIYKSIFPEKKGDIEKLITIVKKGFDKSKIRHINKEQKNIADTFFIDKTIYDRELDEMVKNDKNISEFHDSSLYEFSEFIEEEEQDMIVYLDEVIEKNKNINNQYLERLNSLFELWRGIKG